MSKTVTSLYQSQERAADAVTRLEQTGVSRSDITVYSNPDSDVADTLDGLGVPRSDAHAYSEGVRRGGSLVVVKCDDSEVERVIDVLDGHGALDLDEQQSTWRSEGWTGYDSSMSSGFGTTAAGLDTGRTGTDQTRAGMAARSDRGEREEVIPIAEEELHVGKREVSHGRVRINAHTVERPVQEQVTLRDETVDVERRPVSGDRATTMTGDPFRERTIEVEERDEEAVVSKEARVKEELVVRKGVEERTETVSDKVRRTEVDIEDDRGVRGTGTKGPTDRNR